MTNFTSFAVLEVSASKLKHPEIIHYLKVLAVRGFYFNLL